MNDGARLNAAGEQIMLDLSENSYLKISRYRQRITQARGISCSRLVIIKLDPLHEEGKWHVPI